MNTVQTQSWVPAGSKALDKFKQKKSLSKNSRSSLMNRNMKKSK